MVPLVVGERTTATLAGEPCAHGGGVSVGHGLGELGDDVARELSDEIGDVEAERRRVVPASRAHTEIHTTLDEIAKLFR